MSAANEDCLDRLVRHWYVCHPDGQDLGLIAPRFDTEAEAIAKRDLWNIDVPGHYVMGIGEARVVAPQLKRRGR